MKPQYTFAITSLVILLAPLITSTPPQVNGEPCSLMAGQSYSDILECKSIIAKGDATRDDCTLHMKIRDPSRPGEQVLFICEPGLEYTYHHPTTGEDMHFTITNRVIGVATLGDTPPNIMKAGMALTTGGISYGDNDINLLFCNPSPYAWDDFDWLRYGYQTATTEEEAITLLVDEAVHELHATGKGEVLYVVGPERAYVIEANAKDAAVEEINDIYVRTNYAVQLWESAAPERYLYAPHFETRFDGWATQGEVVKLGVDCAYGILVEDVGGEIVRIRAIHEDHESVDLHVGEVKTLSGFRVGLKEVDHHSIPQAHITLCYHYLEWKERMEDIVMREHGNITERHLMNWSRLQRDDLGGLRPMCEASDRNHEAVAIYKIPAVYPETMSSFWFTSYSRSSIYVPVHLCVRDIYEPYRTGEACRLSKSVFELRGNDKDTVAFEMAESVFIDENDHIEAMAFELLENGHPEIVPILLTSSDMMMQEHVLLTLELHLRLGELDNTGGNDSLGNAIERIWRNDYIESFEGLRESLSFILQYSDTTGESSAAQEVLVNMTELLIAIAKTAAEYCILEAECIPGGDAEGVKEAWKQYNKGKKNVDNGRLIDGMKRFEKSFRIARCVMNHEDYSHLIKESEGMSDVVLYTILTSVILLGVVIAYLKKGKGRGDKW